MGLSRRRLLKLGAFGLTSAALGAVGSRWLPSAEAGEDFRRLGANGADKAPSDVAWRWFEQLYDIVKAEATSPPAASRIYGISAVALYEAIVEGTKRHRSLAGQLNGLNAIPSPENPSLHWGAAANAALAATIRGLYSNATPASLNAIQTLEQTLGNQLRDNVSGIKYTRSVAHGDTVARAVLDWATGDGFAVHNNCPYVAATVAGAWVPTGPNPNPLQPCWGHIRTMAMPAGDACPPAGHPAFSADPASAFHAAAMEVYNVGRTLTDEQRTIASYWADGAGATGTPPGHWIAIVSQLARNERLSLAEAAEAYARVGIAVHDAFICCWHVKYATNLQRPVTYIRNNIDAGWAPFIATPNFPAYTSGHSTQSGAAATVLSDMFGLQRFTDTTHADHGLTPAMAPRTFASFEEAAAEAAVSRLYGGIHYPFDNDDGFAAGQCIGRTILERVRFRRRSRTGD
jgi:PAP2 superfamily